MQDGQAQRDVQLGDHSASDPASVLTQHMEVKSQAISSRASGLQPSAAFLARVPHAFARQHLLLSLGVQGERELLAVTRSTSPAAVWNVAAALEREVTTVPDHCHAEALATLIDNAYAATTMEQARDSASDVPVVHLDQAVFDESTIDPEADLRAALQSSDADLLNTSGKGPVIRLVDLILFQALQRNASDVHIQPVGDRALVRYRLDGVLHTVRELPPRLIAAVTSRVKIIARMDVAEQRAPQDGRATVTSGGGGGAAGSQRARRVDLRISTLPTTYGERIVIRLLDTSKSPHLLSLSKLGMPRELEASYLSQVSRASGIVLVTGPTGSGKSTTLYTTLSWITQANSRTAHAGNAGVRGGCELNIMTIEDPVEYDLATAGLSISQTQLNAKKGVTFASGLRHILRQDPDVIMVGEIRDDETARIAVQASLTGHLVLSTLHTNDAPSAVARLLDLGVEPFLVSSSVAAVLAQRLVRTRHAACDGVGCELCFQTGFLGRTGVFEFFAMNEELRELVVQRAGAQLLKEAARRRGMRTLLEAGLVLADARVTTRDEVMRVIESADAEVAQLEAPGESA
ncbi:MAG: GspE/PulE family protein [Phycisphaerales bacterium]